MIENHLRPKMEAPPHPPYHQGEYLEEYFYSFYLNNKNEFDKTGYSLIPIFWSNITYNVYVRHTDQAIIINRIQTYLATLPAAKYFAVSRHDNAPFVNLPDGTVSFAAGGNTGGIPLPLICSPIPVLDVEREKDIFCSFVGSNTHSIRETLFRYCMHDSVFHIKHKEWSIDVSDTELMYFIDITTRSKFSLCPRGAAPTSFRMYEILQLNSIPVIVYDKKWLPFEDVIDYASFCVLVHEKEIPYLKNILNNISDNQQCKMLQKGKEVYAKYFTLEGMCNQILQILEAAHHSKKIK